MSLNTDSSSCVINEEAPLETVTATSCPRCGTDVDWSESDWCLQCGYHPKYEGEISPTASSIGQPALHCEQNAQFRIAPWAIVLIAGIVGLIGLSAYVGFYYSGDVHFRAVWSLSQIGTGLVAVTIAQIAAFLFASFVNGEKIGVMDWMMKPIYIWFSTFNVLPKKAWSVWLMSWGVAAIIAAMTLIGGIRYSAIFDDWGFVPHAQVNLVQEIVEQAREAEGGPTISKMPSMISRERVKGTEKMNRPKISETGSKSNV
ncbi:MAG: hypothetical protein O2955_14765 [Planctomycetota bacterium]|nr:hypothetical protein [Planctomycetota bacterium]MDA1213775.1 hypothetical protein [Planctomycetota bacterium]